MSGYEQGSRVDRLRNKALACIDTAVGRGEVTTSSYNYEIQSGSTYAETLTDEEITRFSDGTVHIMSTDYLTMIYSVTIPRNGRGVMMIQHGTDSLGEIGDQLSVVVPSTQHEAVANLLLANMCEKIPK